jgi:hypothetical protein
MTKLTTWMRECITKDLLKYRFGHAAQEFAALKSALALDVYNDVFSDKERKAMAELPRGWLPEVSKLGVQFGDGRNYVEVSFNGATYGSIAGVFPEALSVVLMPVPSRNEHGCAKVYEATHPFSERYDAIKRKQADLEREIDTAKRQAEAAIMSASTINKLVTLWPEIEPFTVRHVPRGAPVPALPTSELNALLGLPVTQAA